MDLFPLWLSLKVSVTATILTAGDRATARIGCSLVGAFPAATSPRRVVVLPLVLPPTVLGYYLLVLISRQGASGECSTRRGIELAFTWRAAVLAAWVGSSALFIKAAQAGFESVDRRLEQAALTLGRSEWSVFWICHAAARLARRHGRHRARVLPGARRLRHHAHGRWQHSRRDADDATGHL